MAVIWGLKLGSICLFFHSCNPVPVCKNDQHVHWKARGQGRGGRWREADNDLRTWGWDLLPRWTLPLPRSCLSFPICDMMVLVAWDSEVSSRSIVPDSPLWRTNSQGDSATRIQVSSTPSSLHAPNFSSLQLEEEKRTSLKEIQFIFTQIRSSPQIFPRSFLIVTESGNCWSKM